MVPSIPMVGRLGGVGTLVVLAACGRGGPPPDAGPSHGHGHAHGAVPARGAFHHRFEDAAAWSKVFDDPARDAWQKPELVVKALAIAPGMVVADVGAGTGYFEPYLARAVGPAGRVLAVDVEPDMVRWLGERAARENLTVVTARLAAPDDPGLETGSVDRVLVVDTWHHLGDRRAYAAKLARALRPRGLVAVVDFTLTSPEGPPAHARVAADAVAAELVAAGLRARTLPVDLPNQYVVVGERAE